MKKVNATFEVENDLAEYNLRNALEGLGAKYVQTYSSVEHIKNNTSYKKLVKANQETKKKLQEYINKNY